MNDSKNLISTEVLEALSPKLQGMLADSKDLKDLKVTFQNSLEPKDSEIDLTSKDAKDNSRARLLYRTDTGRMITFPIRQFLNIEVKAKKTAKTSKKMYDAMATDKPKFSNFTVVSVTDSLDSNNKIYPVCTYVLYEEISTDYYKNNPDAKSQDFWDANPRLKSMCLEDNRIIDVNKNFKDITVVFS